MTGPSARSPRRGASASGKRRASRARVRDGRAATTGTMLARGVGKLLELAVAEGMNRHVLIDAAGLTGVDLADPDSRVPVSVQVALWRLIAKGIADPGFGVRGGASMKVRETGLLGYVMSSSATLGNALRRLVRYSRVLTDAFEFRLEAHGQHIAIAQSHPALGLGLPFAEDARLSALLSVCRQITGAEIVPVEVAFTYQHRASTLEHQRFFRCPLKFGQPHSKLVLFEHDLALPVPRGDETLAGYLSSRAETVLGSLVTGASTRERVRSAIWATLSEGRPTVTRVATALHLPPRTLQRRLANEGTSLHRELEDVRKTMAMAMLRDRTHSIDEVAFLLGYAESSTLFRSFRRWTAMTPQQYRAEPG